MNQSKITTRYAKALFKLAVEQDLLDRFKQDLDLVKSVIDIKEFKDFLASPVISESVKSEVFKEVFAGKVHDLVSNFLQVVVENRRETLLDIIILDYFQLYKEHLGIAEAQIITAVELPEKLAAEVKKLLKQYTDKKIQLDKKIDPEILGGFILRIDDKQLDASVAGRLRKIRKELLN